MNNPLQLSRIAQPGKVCQPSRLHAKPRQLPQKIIDSARYAVAYGRIIGIRAGGAMTNCIGESGRCRKARPGETGCKDGAIPRDKLDSIVAGLIEERLLDPERLEDLLATRLDRRE